MISAEETRDMVCKRQIETIGILIVELLKDDAFPSPTVSMTLPFKPENEVLDQLKELGYKYELLGISDSNEVVLQISC